MILGFYENIILIVVIQSILLLVYYLIVDKSKNNIDILDEKLKTINAILKNTKHESIISLKKLKDIEDDAKEVYVFSKDMLRDVKNSGQFSDDAFNVGTFYEIVNENLKKESAKYIYFIKKDSHWKHFIYSFKESYLNIEGINDKVKFHLINENKYFFYDEIYLYIDKDDNKRAFEFLPSISNEKEKSLYYLELTETQVNRLFLIKDNLTHEYKEKSLSDLIVDIK